MTRKDILGSKLLKESIDEKLNQRSPVSIVVIDSGIDKTIYDLNEYIKYETGFILDKNGIVKENKKMKPAHPHGTGVALIIRHLCKNVEIISFNILNDQLKSDGRILLHALEQGIRLNPDIIHMSLGTTRWRYCFKLRMLTKKAKQNKIFLVAAVHNERKRSYPAYTKGVIGVKHGCFPYYTDYGFKKGFYLAPPDAMNIEGMNLISGGVCGNSASAAYITGHLSRALSPAY